MNARTQAIGALLSLAAATLWVVLAWRTPTSTHHFAPLVIAGAWGYAVRNGGTPPARAATLVTAAGGFGLALAAQLLLTVAGKLDGPPLVAAIPVPVELIAMGAAGALIGSKLWTAGRTRELDRAGS